MRAFRTIVKAALFALILQAATITAAASDTPVINVSDSTGKVGELIEVSVSLENNPGIVTMRLNVEYDESVLKLVNTIDKGVLGNATHYPGPDFHSPYILFWINGTARENYNVNGDIATLRFEVLKEAANSPITVTYDLNRYDVLNASDQKVNFSINNGMVTAIGSDTGVAAGVEKPVPDSEAASFATESSGAGTAGTSGTSANRGSSAAETHVNPDLVIIPPDSAADPGAGSLKSSKIIGSEDIPLANSEAVQTISWWVWLIIAIGINATGAILIMRINNQKNN